MNQFNELILSFPENQIVPGTKPEGFVANWQGTALYRKASFLGRIWQVIHWIHGTSDSSMKKAVLAIAEIAEQTLRNQDRKNVAETVLEAHRSHTFWDGRNLNKLNSDLIQTIRFQSFKNLVSCWAKGEADLNESALQKAMEVMELEKRVHTIWRKADVSLYNLERELKKEYPLTQKNLESRRDVLQAQFGEYPPELEIYTRWTCVKGPTKCPEKLLYGPLVAIAREIRKAGISREDYSFVLNTLTDEFNRTKKTLLDIIAVMEDPAANHHLPPSIANAIQNPNWVSLCGLGITKDDSDILGVERRQELLHRKTYCFERNLDGTESIQVRTFTEYASG